MAPQPDLSPLTLSRAGNHLCFRLKDQEEIFAELPPDYEQFLASELEEILSSGQVSSAEIDLENAPALSSRQLGSLIALQKVLRKHFDRVPVQGLSAKVRHLLELTRTDQFFDV